MTKAQRLEPFRKAQAEADAAGEAAIRGYFSGTSWDRAGELVREGVRAHAHRQGRRDSALVFVYFAKKSFHAHTVAKRPHPRAEG